MRVNLFIGFFFFKVLVVHAQSFSGEAMLPAIQKDGFYRIAISPDASVHLNATFSNIRIFDKGNKEVPFLFEEEIPNQHSQVFKEYEILKKEQIAGCCTAMTLFNPEQKLLNNINLIIKNADVTKEATLLGSDDLEHWFALKEKFFLQPSSNKNATSEVKIVDFPLSNYRYFSLRISDSTSAPLNILSAGYFEVRNESGKYTSIPLHKIVKADSISEKNTYLHLYFDTLRVIDRLELAMKGVPFFRRKAFLYEKKERTLKKGKTEKYYDLLQEVELNSQKFTGIELPGSKSSDLLLVIENKDSPPLDVDFCNAYFLNRYLIAYLKANTQYVIKFGEERMAAADYDLAFFKDMVPSDAVELEMGAISIYPKDTVEPAFTFFTSKVFIWTAVVLVIGILGFMSIRLIKDTEKSSGGN